MGSQVSSAFRDKNQELKLSKREYCEEDLNSVERWKKDKSCGDTCTQVTAVLELF